jgi:hypothetical protein
VSDYGLIIPTDIRLIWLDGAEAKLKSDTGIDVIQAELKGLNDNITA